MTKKTKLILFLISCDPGVRDIYRLVKFFDRADFTNGPSNMTENLKVLLNDNLIIASKWFDSKIEPSEYSITEKGKTYLDENFDDKEIIDYINNMAEPGILLEVTKAYIDKKNKISPKENENI